MPKPGDKVRIKSTKGEFTGVLMPRPELLSDDVIVIKIKNGYNVGFDKKHVKKVELVEESKPSKPKPVEEVKHNPELPTVAILSTGGTISSRIDYTTGAVYADYSAKDFVAMCPELSDFANIKARKILSVMSEDVLPKDWLKMAKEIKKELAGCDGVVLTHGTDTLHFTSSALSFLLENLGKPVVVTGAQRSIDRGSSDAFMNLVCSVAAASKIKVGKVFACLHGTISDDFCLLINGVNVRKMHTSRRDTFRPINSAAFARVFPDGRIDVLSKDVFRGQEKRLSVAGLDVNVRLVYAYPGMPNKLDLKDVHGVVIAATALGHVPTANGFSLVPEIKKAVKKGIPVIITSQTLYGSTHPFVYSNLRKLSMDAKAIFVKDMLPEVAYTKLMYVLAKTKDLNKIKELMQKDLRGEVSEREVPGVFMV